MRIFYFLVLFGQWLYASDLHWAIKAGRVNEAIYYIEHTENSDDLNIFEAYKAPIHLAIEHDKSRILQALIKYKADINLESKLGETPIILAFKIRNYPMVIMLEGSGARLEGELFYKYLLGKKLHNKWPETNSLCMCIDDFTNIMQNSLSYKAILYIYAFFYTDLEFFENMIQIARQNANYKPSIGHFLRELALEGFPLGPPPKDALEKLNELLDEIDASRQLRFQLWKTIKQSTKQTDQTHYNRPEKSMALADEILTPQLIAEVITQASESFMRSLHLRDIMVWLKDDKSGASVQTMAQFSNRLINWLTFQIVAQPDAKLRLKLARKIIHIGQELYKVRNYWGVAQMVSVLSKKDISKLWSGKKAKKIDLEIHNLVELVDTERNCKTYRANLSESMTKFRVFPHIDIIFKDLQVIYAGRPKVIQDAWVVQMASIFKDINNYKTKYELFGEKNRMVLAFFHNLPMIEDAVIEAYSDLRLPFPDSISPNSLCIEKALENWTCRDLVTNLVAKELYPCLPALLDAGLWDGRKISKKLFSQDLKKGYSDRVNFLLDNGVPSELVKKLEQMLYLAR